MRKILIALDILVILIYIIGCIFKNDISSDEVTIVIWVSNCLMKDFELLEYEQNNK